ncbi:MAG: tRNA(adenine34) deaminase [Lentisphaeria bacterium]|jgi:tRNA(adenine34) deaminase
MSDETWMAVALKNAKCAFDLGEVPVGAVIVRNECIIGEGWNQPITRCDPSAHAEIVALRAAGKSQQNYRLPGATLYVTIEPCTMCLGAMIHSRIGRIVFGASEPKAGVLESHRFIVDSDVYNHDVTWQGGVCEDECTAIIQQFFRSRREQKKKERAQKLE